MQPGESLVSALVRAPVARPGRDAPSSSGFLVRLERTADAPQGMPFTHRSSSTWTWLAVQFVTEVTTEWCS